MLFHIGKGKEDAIMTERNKLYQDYCELEKKRKKDGMTLQQAEEQLKNLESKIRKIEKVVRDENEGEIFNLKNLISNKQMDIKNQRSKLVKEPDEFDLDSAYKKYDAESDILVKKQQEEIIKQRDNTKYEIAKIHGELQESIQKEVAMVEKDQKLMGHIEELRRTRETGNLPEVISSNLETVSEEELIEKYKIQNGNSIVK